MLVDSHAHLTSPELIGDVDLILARAQANHIEAIINVCTDADNIAMGIPLSKKYPWVYQAAAVHPHDAEKEGESFYPIVEQHALKGEFVAIGETGLDYHYHHSSPSSQQYYLKKQLHLAIATHLPVIIHCREAFQDFFHLLDSEYKIANEYGPGVLHCFTGDMNEALHVLERGFYISFSGIITFKKSIELREIVHMVPLEKLLIETDAPFLAPQSRRGKTNEPSFITETAEVVASIKGISLEKLAEATSQNTRTLFKLT